MHIPDDFEKGKEAGVVEFLKGMVGQM